MISSTLATFGYVVVITEVLCTHILCGQREARLTGSFVWEW